MSKKVNIAVLFSSIGLVLMSWASSSIAASNDTTLVPTSPAKQVPEQPSITPTKWYSIIAIDSNEVAFSRVKSSKEKNGYAVSGDIRIKSMKHRVLRFPGYVSIVLKAADGSELESIKARYHSKFSGSKSGHFDAVLKTTPPDGSRIEVTHIR